MLALSPVPEAAASARFRLYQYIPLLESVGFRVTASPFCTPELFRILYDGGRYFWKASLFLLQALKRWQLLVQGMDYDLFFVHREILPFGPPVFELALSRIKGKALVYDFDDAIYLPNVSEANRCFSRLKWPQKVPGVIRASNRVVTGNEYLAEYARAYNGAVTVIPTCVDTNKFVPRACASPNGEEPVVGWIGSPTTVSYLLTLREALRRLACSRRFTLCVSGTSRAVEFPGVKVAHLPWSLEDEVSLFNRCDIGIYPLWDDAWTRGKCGFKAIQFMACGVPVVAAAVGVNREIIQDGVNGFLAATEAEWEEKLGYLLIDPGLRKKLGRAARETILERYSLAVHGPILVDLLRSAVESA